MKTRSSQLMAFITFIFVKLFIKLIALMNFCNCPLHSYHCCLLQVPASNYLKLTSLPLLFQLWAWDIMVLSSLANCTLSLTLSCTHCHCQGWKHWSLTFASSTKSGSFVFDEWGKTSSLILQHYLEAHLLQSYSDKLLLLD